MSLHGEKALVTGGSRGIGAAIAKRLAADGASVAITYARNTSAADATVAEIESVGGTAFAFQANAADPTSQRAGVEQAAATLGGIDILVHNAGVAEFSAIADDTDEPSIASLASTLRVCTSARARRCRISATAAGSS